MSDHCNGLDIITVPRGITLRNSNGLGDLFIRPFMLQAPLFPQHVQIDGSVEDFGAVLLVFVGSKDLGLYASERLKFISSLFEFSSFSLLFEFGP